MVVLSSCFAGNCDFLGLYSHQGTTAAEGIRRCQHLKWAVTRIHGLFPRRKEVLWISRHPLRFSTDRGTPI